jgi:transaldolase
MQLFIDSANLDEIREVNSWGILDGVTTNPSLVSQQGGDFETLIHDICELVGGPTSAEVVSVRADEIVSEARRLSKIHPCVVVKVPLIMEGLKALSVLSKEGVKTNVTLCFSASQALLTAKAGATYISPFIGRLDDQSQDGMALIRDIRTIYSNYGYQTKILAASIRHPIHVVDAAKCGADVATIPFKIFRQLIKHPLTDSGLRQFLADWERFAKEHLISKVVAHA